MPRDKELVRASLRGDLKAFAALVDRYRYAVFGLCLSYMRDRDTAEDAAQEAFIKAFLKLRSLADPDRFAPWLKQIAANECRMWRRRQHDQVPLDDALTDELTALQTPPDDELASRETRRRILASLGKLNQVQQQIVTLFYLEDLSLQQIASFLDIPFQTANQRLYRARIRMKEEMLKMVEETLGQQKLPESFTEEVIAAALKRGRQLLEERRWPDAKVEFRKITAMVDDHLEAQRGLALALDGEVNAMFEDAGLPNDEKLMHEAIVALEETYRLGARDSETIWNLAGFYWNQCRHRDRTELLESYAAETDDADQAFRAFVRAAWSARKIPDFEHAFTLHRRALAIEGIPLKDRLTAYFATPLTIYRETGNGDTWLAETEALYSQLDFPLTIVHYMYFRDRTSILMRLERYEEALQTGQHFLNLLDCEEVDAPPQRRWWRSDALGQFIRLHGLMGDAEGLRQVLETARDNLQDFESEWEAAVEEKVDAQDRETVDKAYRRFVANAVHNLGCSCSRAESFDEAIALFERSLRFREVGPGYMFLTSAHVKNGDPAGALDVLRRMHQSPSPAVQRWLFLGEGSRWFHEDEAFTPVREDGDFVELIGGNFKDDATIR